MRKFKKKPVTFSLHESVPVKTVFDRIMSFAGRRDVAAFYLNSDLAAGRLKSVVKYISPDGRHMVTHLTPSNWEKRRQVQALAADETSNRPNGSLLVRRVDFDKRYSIAAMPNNQSDDNRPPERRRGPVTTHDWHSIDGEIARRCIDPKTGRVEVPKKENALVAEMRVWCKEQGWAVPATSEMSEAVRRTCAALRTAQK